MFAFVILKNGVTDDDKVIFEALQKLVRKMIAAFAVPNTFLVSIQFQHVQLSRQPQLYLDRTGFAKNTIWEDHEENFT